MKFYAIVIDYYRIHPLHTQFRFLLILETQQTAVLERKCLLVVNHLPASKIVKFVLLLHDIKKLIQSDGRDVCREYNGPRERNALIFTRKQLKEHILLYQ